MAQTTTKGVALFDKARRRYARIQYVLNAPITELVFGGALKGGKAFYRELRQLSAKRCKDAQAYLDVAKAVYDMGMEVKRSATVRAQGLERKVKKVNIICEESEGIIWVEPPKDNAEAVQDALRLYCINYRFYDHNKSPCFVLNLMPREMPIFGDSEQRHGG